VPCTKHAADGKTWWIKLFQAAKVGFWAARLSGVIGKAGRETSTSSDCDQPGEFFPWKPTQNDTAVGTPLQ
jgi:hypothetical protein